MITIQQLDKSFGKLQVLRGIDLKLEQPGITAVLGPNGSGKTTLIKTILGMVLPEKGDILIEGKSVLGEFEYRDRIGYLPQIARFPENLSVRELFALVKDLHKGRTSNEEVLINHFGLHTHLDKRLGNLSGGTKQKVNLTLTFMYDNPFLILDEPTAGLDPVALIRFKELLLEAKSAGKQIILTTHIMSLVEELADEIVFLLEGKIYYRGTVKHLEETYGETNLEHAIANILLSQNGYAGYKTKSQQPASTQTMQGQEN